MKLGNFVYVGWVEPAGAGTELRDPAVLEALSHEAADAALLGA